MNRNSEHLGILVECQLRAVAVMNVPVHHGDSIDGQPGPGIHQRDGYIGEYAEAPAPIRFGMVTRWAHQRIRVVDRAFHDFFNRRHYATRRQHRDFKGTRSEWSQLAGVAAALRRMLANQFDVFMGVKTGEVFFRGRSWPDGLQVLEEPRGGQKIVKPSLGFWVLEACSGLRREGAAAGIVPHVELIEHEAGLSFRHGLSDSRRVDATKPGPIPSPRKSQRQSDLRRAVVRLFLARSIGYGQPRSRIGLDAVLWDRI